MHLGPYDDEPITIDLMHQFAEENGYKLDITDKRRHLATKIPQVAEQHIQKNHLFYEFLYNSFLWYKQYHMGCIEAKEYHQLHVKKEPFDCQMECAL